MNFFKCQSGRLIVQGDIVTIFKKYDLIQTSPLVKEIICQENEEYNKLRIELNQLEPLKKIMTYYRRVKKRWYNRGKSYLKYR